MESSPRQDSQLASGPNSTVASPSMADYFAASKAPQLLVNPQLGQIIEANPAAIAFYGYSANAFNGMPLANLNALPLDAPHPHTSSSPNSADLHHAKHQTSQGDIRTVQIHITPFNSPQTPLQHWLIHDVTAWIDGEQNLHSKFETIYNNSPVMIQTINRAGRIMAVNNSWLKKMGIDEVATVLEQPFTHYLSEASRNYAAETLLPTLWQQGALHDARLTLIATTGDSLDVALFAEGGYDQKTGEITHSICHLIDITAHKKAQTELKASEAKYRTLFDHAGDAIYIVDGETGRILEANPHAGKMLGYTQVQLYTMTADQVYSPADRETVMADIKEIAATQGAKKTVEVSHQHQNGQLIPVEVQATSLVYEGRKAVLGIVRNMSSQLAIQNQLRLERNRARQYLDVAGVMIVALSNEQTILQINRRGCEILECDDRESLIGKNWFNLFVSPEERTNVKRVFNMIISGNDEPVRHYENPVKTLKGNIRHISWYNNILRDANGNIIGLLSSGEDITEQHQIAMALRASEERFQLALKGANDGLWDWNLNTDQVYYSPRWLEMLGYGPHELPHHLDVWQSLIHPEDSDKSWQHFHAYMAGESPRFEIEFRMRHKAGHWVPILSRAFKQLDPKTGKPIRLAGTHVDLTEIRAAEAALRQKQTELERVHEITHSGYYSWEAKTGTWTSSKVLDELFGVDPDTPHDYETWVAVIAPDFREEMSDYFANEVLAKRQPFDREYKIINLKTGVVKWVHGMGELALDEAGEVTRMFGTIQDITPRRMSELALQATNQQLEQAMSVLQDTQTQMVQQERLAAVGQLSAGIAHDFNNILTSILGFAELLQISSHTSEQSRKPLEHIRSSAERAANLVRQILDFSRKSIHKTEAVNLDAFVQQTGQFIQRTIPENISLQTMSDTANVAVTADETQLQQVFTNLVINARDAMPDGGNLMVTVGSQDLNGETECAICHQPITGSWGYLCVEDTGQGIPAEVQTHIFEPFFTTKDIGAGTGLGLSQVYGIIAQHNGHITVNSQLDEGSTFCIYLPLVRQQSPAKSTADVTQLLTGNQETILVVEDEPEVLMTTKKMLERLNYRVITASSGAEAIARFEAHHPEIRVAILDYIMPDIDGEKLFYILIDQQPSLKIILMSGYPLQDKVINMQYTGLFDWFKKPISLKNLSQIVHRACNPG